MSLSGAHNRMKRLNLKMNMRAILRKIGEVEGERTATLTTMMMRVRAMMTAKKKISFDSLMIVN